MNKDRTIGTGILGGSIIGIILYLWLLFFSPWTIQTIQLTAFIAVAGILAILAWIGWTLATTPPPTPIEEISPKAPLEVEVEEEGDTS